MDRLAQLAALRRVRELKRMRGSADVRWARGEADVARARWIDATHRLAEAEAAVASRRQATLASASGGVPGHALVSRIERLATLSTALGVDERSLRDAEAEMTFAQRRTDQAEARLIALRRRERAVEAAHHRQLERTFAEAAARAESSSEEERADASGGVGR